MSTYFVQHHSCVSWSDAEFSVYSRAWFVSDVTALLRWDVTIFIITRHYRTNHFIRMSSQNRERKVHSDIKWRWQQVWRLWCDRQLTLTDSWHWLTVDTDRELTLTDSWHWQLTLTDSWHWPTVDTDRQLTLTDSWHWPTITEFRLIGLLLTLIVCSNLRFGDMSGSIIYNKPTRCNSDSIVFINNYKYALHVSDALCVHLQEH